MGFTPQEVNQMSVWQFAACLDGWNRYHGDGKPEPPTEDEFDATMAEWERVYGDAAVN